MERTPEFNQKVVTFGGGTGHFTLLRGLRQLNEPSGITAVVGNWDSGGSSGRLRAEIGALPPGDFNQCLLALVSERQLPALQPVFKDRLRSLVGPLNGHSFSNLQYSVYVNNFHSVDDAIKNIRDSYLIDSYIYFVSSNEADISAKHRSGRVTEGETDIDTRGEKPDYEHDPIVDVYFDTVPEPNVKVLEAIEDADKIVFAPGDLYTSLMPHLKVKGIRDAIIRSKAEVCYIMNLMTKKGETDGFKASDFLERFVGVLKDRSRLNYIVANYNGIPEELLARYLGEGQKLVDVDEEGCRKFAPNAKVVRASLTQIDEDAALVRHDAIKLARAVLDPSTTSRASLSLVS